MKDLINRIMANHEWLPSLVETERLIDEFEVNRICRLPSAVKEFYKAIGRASLFGSYNFLSIPEIAPVGLLQAGENGQGWCSPSWFAFCDMCDSDYVSIDIETFNVLDCDHNQLGECTVIAKSFSEFVARALDSEGDPYWLSRGFEGYGVVTYEPTLEFYRNLDSDWWESLGSETGPEQCKAGDCQRQRIKLSVMCRRHHYEMIQKRACPFDD